MHVHIGALEFLVFAAKLIIASFLLRLVSWRWPESAIGKAIAVII